MSTIPAAGLHRSNITSIDAGRTTHRVEENFVQRARTMLVAAMALLGMLLIGCGQGGYVGGAAISLSRSTVTIDAGQSINVTSTGASTANLSWVLAGGACSASTCGTLSAGSGSSVTYSAPVGITAPMTLTLTGSLPGTNASSVVSITVNPDPTILGTPPAGVVGTPYTTTLTAHGGTGALHWSVSGGSLPAGLSFNTSSGIISGTPTAPGSSTLTVQVVDSSDVPFTVTAPESVTISNAAAALTISGNPPAGTVGSPYTAALQASGGTAPYTWSITAGSLPSGLSLSASSGVISGTPATPGTSVFTAQVQDASGLKSSAIFSIVINAAQPTLALTVSMLPNGTVGVPYSATIGVTGGTAPYTCVFTAGTLPAGLSLSGCVVSGTPAAAGTSNLTVKATDASTPVQTISGPESITINATALKLTTSSLPNGTVGVPYSATIGVGGGTAPYSCVFTAGTLPAGLSLSGCTVSGTPTVAGMANLTVKATDSSSPAQTVSGPESITISPVSALALTLSSLPNGTVGVPYSATIGVSGGTSPYSCVFTSGTLPAGLSLSGCVVSGTPTAPGTSNLTVQATDSSVPAATTSGPISITISPAPSLVISSPPNGTVGTPYTGSIPVTGGKAPYTCVLTGGTLPAGLSLNGCVLSGTPTVAGTSNLTVKATDASSPAVVSTGPVTLVIASAPLVLATSPLPNGTVGVPYSASIGVSGGTAPYTCAFTAGTLPAGLTLTGCTVSGTPTIAGTANLTVKATDSSNPAQSTSGPESITIAAAPLLTLSSPPSATVGTPYTGPIPVTGGTAPYTCVITSGTLPSGLSLTGCTISGTPLTAGAFPITVKATDSSNPAATVTGPVTVTVNSVPSTITVGNPPAATVGAPYNAPIPVAGGSGPYTCTLNSGTLPQGLTLLSGCVLSGTPVVAGPVTVSIRATDSSQPPNTGTGVVVVTVNPVATLTLTGSLPNAVLGQPYTQTLQAAGGIGPYSYAVTAGTLPTGLTLSASGVVSGTPTQAGASSFTVTATDAEGTPQTASLPLVLLVAYPTTATDAQFTGPYAFLFQGYDDVVAGVLAYKTATVGSFIADGSGLVHNGELDSNHQGSTAAGATVSSRSFLGTYQVGADDRGLLTLTTLNADGTTGRTTTYAISLKAPVAPSTISTQAAIIEFDNDQLVGSKGSGSILAQTAGTFAAGLNGSYAFGLQGDTPCLPTCTIGVIAGPAAAVGQFTANGSGAISAGTTDVNIASANFATLPLSGSYGAADSNGRVQLSLTTGGLPAGVYPSDYAVYVVNANQAFLMSTDKHSSYILLSGSTQLQTQSIFGNASLTGSFIGYENAPTNPGLVSATLQNVLNLSTATIFRATATADGNCNVTNVDEGGVTSLVSTLTGLGGSATGLDNLLGTFRATGPATCAVSTSGRGVLQYPQQNLLGLPVGAPPAPRVVYLSSPDRGFFLETGYAGLGNIEPQTGGPFSLGTFNGTFVYASSPASSLVSINSSGFIQANGAGQANSTTDLNVGVGTINVLQLGVTRTSNYVYASTDSATGRYVLDGTTVIYAISPNRFVLVDTNPATTSPTVTLLY